LHTKNKNYEVELTLYRINEKTTELKFRGTHQDLHVIV